jgi:hypothetical protein
MTLRRCLEGEGEGVACACMHAQLLCTADVPACRPPCVVHSVDAPTPSRVASRVSCAARRVLCAALFLSHGWRSSLVVPGAVGVAFAGASWLGLRPFDPPKPKSPVTLPDILTALRVHVFSSSVMWRMGIAYFFISIIRSAMTNWAFSYLAANPVGGWVCMCAAACSCLWLWLQELG